VIRWIAGAFKELKGTALAEDQSLKANGLAQPKVITVKGNGKGAAAGCAIRVGDQTKDKVSYYVASARGNEVYLVPKWSIDRVLIEPVALGKAAVKAPLKADKPAPKLAAKK